MHEHGSGELRFIAHVSIPVDSRRLAACWNACEGLSTENLEDNISIKDGLRGLNANISAARALLYAVLKESDNNIAAIRRAGGFVDAPPLAERIRQFLEPKP